MPALWIGHHRKNACPLFIVKSEFQGYNGQYAALGRDIGQHAALGRDIDSTEIQCPHHVVLFYPGKYANQLLLSNVRPPI